MLKRSLLLLCVFLSLMQWLVISFEIPDYLLPTPTQIAIAFYSHFYLLMQNSLVTLTELILSLIFGIVTGCIFGASIALFRPAKTYLHPLLIFSQAIPTFAIAPLIIIWLGYGLSSKIAISTLMIFFPISSAFYDGLSNTPKVWLDLSKTMRANKYAYFWHIRLPAALPDLATGIRIAAVIAPIGAIVGEWIGASQGLGYLMISANARLEIDLMLAALSIIMLLTLMTYHLTNLTLNKLIWWQNN